MIEPVSISDNRKIRRRASLSSKIKAREIKKLIDSSPDQVPTLRTLEKEFSLSKNHLEQGFRELYGVTIGNYSKTIKLNIIKDLLKDHTLTMDTIAIQTGFNGGEALNRFFKQKEGIPPGQWRRKFFDSIQ